MSVIYFNLNRNINLSISSNIDLRIDSNISMDRNIYLVYPLLYKIHNFRVDNI